MRIVFMGTPDFAVPTLNALVSAGHDVAMVVTRPDRPRGRGQKSQPCPVKESAIGLGLRVEHPVRLDDSFIQELKALNIDIGVVVAYGRILSSPLLGSLNKGWINVHASLLPKYRGPAPIHRAVMAGDRVTGITTMLMSEGLDEGDILLQAETPIGANDITGDVHNALSNLGANLLVETLERWEKGILTPTPQKHDQATYAPLLTRADELVIWNRPADMVHNHIRGMNPWPGAYTTEQGKILKLRKGRIRKEALSISGKGAPGEIVALDGEEVAVATGAGTYWLTEVQPAGGKIMPAGAYVRGRRIGTGFRFI